jgi:hypothetical protein
MGPIKKLMAARCKHCPLCRFARANPETLVGKAVAFHGRFCPFWRAYQQVYAAEQPNK